jgi:transposase
MTFILTENRSIYLVLAMLDLAQRCEALEKEVAALSVENKTLRAIIEASARPKETQLEDARQGQIEFAEATAPAGDPSEEQEKPEREAPSLKGRRRARRRVPLAEKLAGLPVGKVTHIVPEPVAENPDLYREAGSEESVEVIYRSARIELHKIVRKKFVAKACPKSAPVVAKSPPRFSSSFVSASLAVAIVLDKYAFHGTLYRMERKFGQMGIDLSRKTQSDAVERFSQWVRPIYELLKRRLLEKPYLQIDETFVKYVNGKLGGSSTGYFWAVTDPEEGAVMEWIPNRRHANAESVLEGWIPRSEGEVAPCQLQSDGYAAYEKYAASRECVELLACWAHAFRKLRDALKTDPTVRPAMTLIGKLYDLERGWAEAVLGDEARKAARAEKSLPIAAEVKAELEKIASDVTTLPSSDARKAAAYALNRWEALEACLRHGHTRLDTNALERQFRDSAIGKKNWMFIGHPQAGQKSAIIYTLLASCRVHRINPELYFADILEKLVPADGKPSAELLEELLPKAWIASHPEALVKEQG